MVDGRELCAVAPSPPPSRLGVAPTEAEAEAEAQPEPEPQRARTDCTDVTNADSELLVAEHAAAHPDPMEELHRQLDLCTFSLGLSMVTSLSHGNPATLALLVQLCIRRHRSQAKVAPAASKAPQRSKQKEKAHWALLNWTFYAMIAALVF